MQDFVNQAAFVRHRNHPIDHMVAALEREYNAQVAIFARIPSAQDRHAQRTPSPVCKHPRECNDNPVLTQPGPPQQPPTRPAQRSFPHASLPSTAPHAVADAEALPPHVPPWPGRPSETHIHRGPGPPATGPALVAQPARHPPQRWLAAAHGGPAPPARRSPNRPTRRRRVT
eukprot:CAMPEP_0172199572 /NCGR_PEP_ID=MMETSP1050-20130122/28772_1 /TAXON_ID=233186 /ORGANISM="Cryptomonas curvata, Strain CCAP979/52" /LENGTH=171 /DNA_ID=CAMNT_0012876629 /DNA_START=194 /DNA_END=706 /DNA_ORIENTATION=-